MKAIVCVNENNGIGYRNTIPWKSKRDMSYFREKTIGKGNNAVIMGYNTFMSLNYKPLPHRRNYIITRNPSKIKNLGSDIVVESNIENLFLLENIFDDVFIIGGSEIYKLFEPYIDTLYLNVINNKLPCDVFFNMNMRNFREEDKHTIDDSYNKLTLYTYKKTEQEL